MKKISTLTCLLVMVCIFGGRAYAQDTSPPSEVDTVVGTNVSGLITQNTTWSKAGSPYIVTGD
ncbi:MAG: hypothetical protein GY850_13240, partial [bacterium]|nr:hypothetical protein [bacterium]